MSRAFRILSDDDAREFDKPPKFNLEQRKQYFFSQKSLDELLRKNVRGDENRVHFVVAFGYFKATKRFYEETRPADRAFVARRYGLSDSVPCDDSYDRKRRAAHRELILDFLGCHPFEHAKEMISQEIRIACRSQISL